MISFIKTIVNVRLMTSQENASTNQYPKLTNRIIGIDLGTTNTVVSYVENCQANSIPSIGGDRLIPSVVCIDKNKNIIVGATAKRQMIANPENTYYSVKRLIGRDSKDIKTEELEFLNYKTISENSRIKLFSPELNRNIECEEISSYILMQAKESADRFFGEDIGKCVITVPAYFDSNQRNATLKAAKIANLEVIRIINEPTAAAISYDFKDSKDHNVIVADLGGGTFDLSLVSSSDNEYYEVKATIGDSQLGGDDFSKVLYDYVINNITKQGLNVNLDSQIKALILKEVEKAKEELSFQNETEIILPILPTEDNKITSFESTISCDLFEKLSIDLIKRIESLITEFLEMEKVNEVNLTDVILVGGSSRIKFFQDIIEKSFNLKPNIDLNPDEVVSNGAAICGEITEGNQTNKIITDITPLALGVEVVGDIMNVQIPENTTIPYESIEDYSTYEDFQENCLISIYQGQRPIASENIKLGSMMINDIEIARAGRPKIEVIFRIDIDGILKVKAIDSKTKSECNITIENSLDIPDIEIEKIRIMAQKFYNEDQIRLRKAGSLLEVKRLIELIEIKYAEELSNSSIDQYIMKTINEGKNYLENPDIFPTTYYRLIKDLKYILD
tara:strand:+ start:415 stop:2274 length:1860 start_codon:yes stop_codon:yes gene_type:complete